MVSQEWKIDYESKASIEIYQVTCTLRKGNAAFVLFITTKLLNFGHEYNERKC